jgi:hypothetical protein
MVTVFFGVDRIALLDVLPSGAKFTSDYFCSNVTEALTGVAYPEERKPRAVRYVLPTLKKFDTNWTNVTSTGCNITLLAGFFSM